MATTPSIRTRYTRIYRAMCIAQACASSASQYEANPPTGQIAMHLLSMNTAAHTFTHIPAHTVMHSHTTTAFWGPNLTSSNFIRNMTIYIDIYACSLGEIKYSNFSFFADARSATNVYKCASIFSRQTIAARIVRKLLQLPAQIVE